MMENQSNVNFTFFTCIIYIFGKPTKIEQSYDRISVIKKMSNMTNMKCNT